MDTKQLEDILTNLLYVLEAEGCIVESDHSFRDLVKSAVQDKPLWKIVNENLYGEGGEE